MTIRAHDLMPMFTAVDRRHGARVDYHDVWQRKNLLLVTLPDDDPTADSYVASLEALRSGLASAEALLIATTSPLEGIPSPAVVIADRWGEVYYVETAPRASGLPSADELMAWVRYVRNECPECQGEAR